MSNLYEYNPQPFSSIKEMVKLAADESGDKIGYMYKTSPAEARSITFREFYENTECLGAALTDLGFGKSHIACIGENSYKWILTFVTVLKSAGVFVPIDKELPPADMNHLLCDSESEVIFFSKKYETYVRENLASLPGVKLFVGFDIDEDSQEEKILSFDSLLKKGENIDKSAYDALETDPYELKYLVYTSGTTGIAKGVMLTEHNIVSGIYHGLRVAPLYEKGLSVLPYNHTYEAVCDILVSIHNRTTLCINLSMKDIVKDLKFYKPTHIYIVPALAEVLYANILRSIRKQNKEKSFQKAVKVSQFLLKFGIDIRAKLFRDLRDVFGGNLKKIVCGGAPIRADIGEFFKDIGIYLTGGYGITECSPLVSVNDENCNTYDTAGFRLPCLEWRIDSPNEEGIGEICVKGDVVMKGYYHMPEKTAEAIRDGWFYTGDYGRLTKDDLLVITGRKKNIIVLNNGKNIYPEEIECRIQNIPYITEVVVRGWKNERGDEVSLMAEVYLEDEKVAEDKILSDIQGCLSDLPDYKMVTKVLVRDDPFPKTTTKKIKR